MKNYKAIQHSGTAGTIGLNIHHIKLRATFTSLPRTEDPFSESINYAADVDVSMPFLRTASSLR